MSCDTANQKQKGSILKKISLRNCLYIAVFTVLCLIIILIYIHFNTNFIPESKLFSEYYIRFSAAYIIAKENNELFGLGEITDRDWEHITKKADGLTKNDFEKVRELDLWFNEYCDISLLEQFSNLQKLNLSGIQYPEKYIPKWMIVLDKARIFNLSEKCLIDFSPLRKLLQLEVLDLSSSKIENIKSLSDLKNLKELNLDETMVSNLKCLRNLTQMQKLSLSGTKICDIEPLNNMILLNTLNLSKTRLTNIEAIKNLSNLQSLNLSETQIKNLEPIKNLINLQELNISKTQIDNLEPLKTLKNLKTIWLSKDQNITKSQVNDLQKALPKTNIYVNHNLIL